MPVIIDHLDYRAVITRGGKKHGGISLKCIIHLFLQFYFNLLYYDKVACRTRRKQFNLDWYRAILFAFFEIRYARYLQLLVQSR